MRSLVRLALALPLAGLLAVGLTAPAQAGDSAPPNGSVVGDWVKRTAGFAQTVTFDSKGNVYGDAGCNRFKGSYTTTATKIKMGPLASTLKYCEGRMDAEQAFLLALQNAKTYRATDTVLKLTSGSSTLRLRAS
jgi:heat shock protein HslJ